MLILLQVIRKAQAVSKISNRVCTIEYEQAFKSIKVYLKKSPILTIPKLNELVGVYLAILEVAISSVLFATSTEQLIQFLSKKLTREEPNYMKMEKLALALVYIARKLQHYFKGRTVIVFIKHRMKQVFENGQKSYGLAQWISLLSTYCISYEPRRA